MNDTLRNAGRTTHLKIVALSLVGAIVVVLVGLNAKTSDVASETSSPVVRAKPITTYARQDASAVR